MPQDSIQQTLEAARFSHSQTLTKMVKQMRRGSYLQDSIIFLTVLGFTMDIYTWQRNAGSRDIHI